MNFHISQTLIPSYDFCAHCHASHFYCTPQWDCEKTNCILLLPWPMMMMMIIYQYKWFFLVVAWCNLLIYFFISLYSPCLFSNSKCWSATMMKHSGTAHVEDSSVYSVIVLLCTTECMNVAFYTILLNCCLHWSRALQLHFYQVFYVRCNSKFGMQQTTVSVALFSWFSSVKWADAATYRQRTEQKQLTTHWLLWCISICFYCFGQETQFDLSWS